MNEQADKNGLAQYVAQLAAHGYRYHSDRAWFGLAHFYGCSD
jgi:hypothetical protein